MGNSSVLKARVFFSFDRLALITRAAGLLHSYVNAGAATLAGVSQQEDLGTRRWFPVEKLGIHIGTLCSVKHDLFPSPPGEGHRY